MELTEEARQWSVKAKADLAELRRKAVISNDPADYRTAEIKQRELDGIAWHWLDIVLDEIANKP